MNVILYGTKKCAETRQAERYLKERRIPFQFRDVSDKPLTANEIKAMAGRAGAAALIDEGSKRYIARGLAFMEYDPAAELEADPALLATPVVRIDSKYFCRPVMSELPLE